MRKGLVSVFTVLIAALFITASFGKAANKATESGLYTGKYSIDQVFDVQRSPAYPVAGQQFTASNFVAPYDANAGDGTSIDWTNNRYVKFEFVGLYNDIKDRPNSMVRAHDSFAQGANPPVVALKLYEANGKLVKTVSATGFVWGLSDEGFLFTAYDKGNDFGYFITNKGAYDYGASLTIVAKKGLVIDNKDLTNFNADKTVKKSKKKKKKKTFFQKVKSKIKD